MRIPLYFFILIQIQEKKQEKGDKTILHRNKVV